MGEANSSVTRVWPVFETLIAGDPSGRTWLRPLLELATARAGWEPGSLVPWRIECGTELPRNLRQVLGEDRAKRLGMLRSCYEVDYPPPARFLRWLIENPSRLTWPTDNESGKGKVPRTFGDPTQSLRSRLVNDDLDARSEALDALAADGAAGSRRKWWAFEGFTSVDCVLESDHLLVLIEGKRTESISAATDWYPQRNQIVRNVEVASCVAAEVGKDFGAILCAETHLELSEQAFTDGLPHLSEPEQKALWAHYWGCVTWQQIVDSLCPNLQLPRNLEDAVRICERLRP